MYKATFKRTSNRYSKEELFNNIKTVWDYKGGQPFCKDMDIYPSFITFGTYFNRFGSWKKAIEEFIKYSNGELKIEKEATTRKVRKNINNSLRYDIMKRDNFKCQYCGASPAKDSDVELQIDHIIPVSKGGDNSIDNLKTICNHCNIGKLNKL